MSSLYKIVTTILKLGLYIGAAGGLVVVTYYLRDAAFNSTQEGIVSLSRLNHSLMGSGQRHTGHHRPSTKVHSK
jgi:hypothetical protein